MGSLATIDIYMKLIEYPRRGGRKVLRVRGSGPSATSYWSLEMTEMLYYSAVNNMIAQTRPA